MAEKKVQEAAAAVEDENHIIAERRAKLAKWRETGHAYPNDFVRKDLFGDIRKADGDKTAEELEAEQHHVSVSGRMMLKRVMGKASFATLRDVTGTMQYFLSPSEVGEEAYEEFKQWISATSWPPKARSLKRSAVNSLCASRRFA